MFRPGWSSFTGTLRGGVMHDTGARSSIRPFVGNGPVRPTRPDKIHPSALETGMTAVAARDSSPKYLFIVILVYAAASLVHFVHNAEFLSDYPNLPHSWSRADVYLAWLAMTAVGVVGWLLFTRGYRLAGLLLLAAYAALGIDSLGHYALAPLSAHTLAMNATILLEVIAAALLLLEVVKQLARRVLRKESH
jgi:hypothetical protein